MIKKEIIKYIEENIDLPQKELLAAIKTQFNVECGAGSELNCFCSAIEQMIELYKKYDSEKITDDMHVRLMSRIKESCSDK